MQTISQICDEYHVSVGACIMSRYLVSVVDTRQTHQYQHVDTNRESSRSALILSLK